MGEGAGPVPVVKRSPHSGPIKAGKKAVPKPQILGKIALPPPPFHMWFDTSSLAGRSRAQEEVWREMESSTRAPSMGTWTGQ